MGNSNKIHCRADDQHWHKEKKFLWPDKPPRKLRKHVDAQLYASIINELNAAMRHCKETMPGWTHRDQRARWRADVCNTLNQQFHQTGRLQQLCPPGFNTTQIFYNWYYVHHGGNGGGHVVTYFEFTLLRHGEPPPKEAFEVTPEPAQKSPSPVQGGAQQGYSGGGDGGGYQGGYYQPGDHYQEGGGGGYQGGAVY